MAALQPRLFEYTRTRKLLTRKEVLDIAATRWKVRYLQKKKVMGDNFRLNIYCRDPNIIAGLEIERIDPASAASSMGNYAVVLKMRPESIEDYTVSIAYAGTRREAGSLIKTIKSYLSYRYGV